MAGRVLSFTIAAISGITIGFGAFNSEFKEQRRRRLEEDYKKEVEAAAPAVTPTAEANVLQSTSLAGHAPKAQRESSQTQSSTWIPSFALWGWRKSVGSTTAKSQEGSTNSADEVNRKP